MDLHDFAEYSRKNLGIEGKEISLCIEKQGLTELEAVRFISGCWVTFLKFLSNDVTDEEGIIEFVDAHNLGDVVNILISYLMPMDEICHHDDLINLNLGDNEKFDNYSREWLKKSNLTELDLITIYILAIITLSRINSDLDEEFTGVTLIIYKFSDILAEKCSKKLYILFLSLIIPHLFKIFKFHK